MDQAPPSPDQDKAPESAQAGGLENLWAELKRRKVMRVAITYAVVAWLIIQIASSTFGWFDIPKWAFRLVTLCVILGFPLAIILAWAFELTPDGIKTTKHAREDQQGIPLSDQQQKKRNWMAYATGALIPTVIFSILALVFFLQVGKEDSAAIAVDQTEVEYEKSIAVLPFTNMSANSEHAYFADGVHETVLTDLTNLRELRVISRTSVMQYRDTTKTMREIGRELGVAFLLEGSMQRAGNQFRLTAQLIDASTDEHLWAKNFDGELTNIFSVQSQLARDVAQGLQAILSPKEEQLIDRAKSASIEAYDLYLKAKEIHHNEVVIASPKALELLEKAVELDPTFTDAWLLIADAAGFIHKTRRRGVADAGLKAKRAIDIAVRLEPDNPKVAVGLGAYYYDCHLDYSRARSYIEPVAERLPNNFDAFFNLGTVSRREGRWADAVKHQERAHLLSPNNTTALLNLVGTYQRLRLFEKAAETYKKMVVVVQDRDSSRYFLRQAAQMEFLVDGDMNRYSDFYKEEEVRNASPDRYYINLFSVGDLQAFEAETKKWLETAYKAGINGRNWHAINQAKVLILLGKDDQASELIEFTIEALEEQERSMSEDFRSKIRLGWVYALIEETAKANTLLNQALAMRSESADAFDGPGLAVERATALAWMGNLDEAVSELTRLSKKPSVLNYYRLKHSLDYYPLREHPGFQALLEDPALKEPLPIKNEYP